MAMRSPDSSIMVLELGRGAIQPVRLRSTKKRMIRCSIISRRNTSNDMSDRKYCAQSVSVCTRAVSRTCCRLKDAVEACLLIINVITY